MTPNYDYGVQTKYMLFLIFIFSLLSSYYVINLEIEYGHAQISVPKISISMLITACISSWFSIKSYEMVREFWENSIIDVAKNFIIDVWKDPKYTCGKISFAKMWNSNQNDPQDK